jgi:LysR family transcriptional regulator, mexEF-oprN operon transcriptional activator
MAPTARAERLARRLRRALVDLTGVLEDAERFDPALARRTFTIASADLAQCVILPALERRLAAEAPGVRLAARAEGLNDDASA